MSQRVSLLTKDILTQKAGLWVMCTGLKYVLTFTLIGPEMFYFSYTLWSGSIWGKNAESNKAKFPCSGYSESRNSLWEQKQEDKLLDIAMLLPCILLQGTKILHRIRKILTQNKMSRSIEKRCFDLCLSNGVLSLRTRCHYTPLRMVKIQNTKSTKCWQRCGATGTPFSVSCNVKWHSHVGRQFGGFL